MANWVNRSRPPSRSSSTLPWDWLSPTVVNSKPEGLGVRNRSLQSSASVREGESKATRKCWLPSKLKVAASVTKTLDFKSWKYSGRPEYLCRMSARWNWSRNSRTGIDSSLLCMCHRSCKAAIRTAEVRRGKPAGSLLDGRKKIKLNDAN